MSTRGIRAQLLQSEEEWAARTDILSRHLAGLVDAYSAPGATCGIEIGCQRGGLTDQMGQLTRVPNWTGIDPSLPEKLVTDHGCTLHPARASRLEFPDATFDVALFANVFEHIPPGERDASLQEIIGCSNREASLLGSFPTLTS